MPRDQRRSKERQTLSQREHAEPSRDNVEAKRACAIHVEATRVVQRAVEAMQCLKGLTQRVLG